MEPCELVTTSNGCKVVQSAKINEPINSKKKADRDQTTLTIKRGVNTAGNNGLKIRGLGVTTSDHFVRDLQEILSVTKEISR